jgi:DNA-binding NarL/FixJ family response regulator
MMPTMTKICIASDIRLYRLGLSVTLTRDERLEIIATAANSEEVLRTLPQAIPDIILIDISMP